MVVQRRRPALGLRALALGVEEERRGDGGANRRPRSVGRVEHLVVVDEGRVDIAFEEARIVEQRLVERDRGADAEDQVFAERASHPANALVAGLTPGDQLADQGVVPGADPDAAGQHAVEPHAGPPGSRNQAIGPTEGAKSR